jgi:hypothetical protein
VLAKRGDRAIFAPAISLALVCIGCWQQGGRSIVFDVIHV